MISSRTCLLSVSISCLLTLPSLTAQRMQLKDALPADTAVYLSLPDISSTLNDLRGMPVGKMWQEGEVQDFFADGLKWFEDHLGQTLAENQETPLKPEDLLAIRLKSAALGITSITLDYSEGNSEPKPNIGIYTLVDFGDSAATGHQIFKGLLAKAQEEAGEIIEVSTSTIGDVELLTIGTDVVTSAMSLNIAFVGTSILIGSRTDETKQVLENLVSGGKGLSASAEYLQVSQKLSLPGAESELYFKPSLITDLITSIVGAIAASSPAAEESSDQASIRNMLLNPEGIERAITALGIRAFQACGSSSTYTGGQCVTRGYTKMDPQLRRGFTAYTESNLNLDFLRWVPKDAVTFSASMVNVGAYYDALMDGMEALSPEIAAQAKGMLAGFEQQLGINLKDDLFGSFGDHYIQWSMPMSGMGAAPEMAILIDIKDQDKLMKALKVAETMSNGLLELDEIDRRGFKAHQLRVNLPNTGGFMAFNPLDMFTPTFVFEGGYMVIGFTTGDVKRTLKRMAREDDPDGDIRSNEEFTPYLEKLPKQGLSSMSFTDWKAQFEGLYQMATGMLAFLPMSQDIPVDLALLPDAFSLTQHLCGSISWVQSSADGEETMAISPWGPEIRIPLAIVFTGGLGAAFLAGARQVDLGGK